MISCHFEWLWARLSAGLIVSTFSTYSFTALFITAILSLSLYGAQFSTEYIDSYFGRHQILLPLKFTFFNLTP